MSLKTGAKIETEQDRQEEIEKGLQLLRRTREQQKKQLEKAKVRRVWLELMVKKGSEKGIVVTDEEVRKEMERRSK